MEPKEQPTSADEEEEVNDSPIEQVRLTVPITYNPTLPVLTFRTWVLGPASCVFVSIFTQYVAYRQLPIPAPLYLLAFLLVPIGKLMAKTLPTKTISIPGTKWTLSMNPGPFNIKEHVLLVVLLNSGIDGGLAWEVIPVMRAFYHKNISLAWEVIPVMNPGPFNIKEHVLLVVLLNSGLDGGLAWEVIPVMRGKSLMKTSLSKFDEDVFSVREKKGSLVFK